MKNRKYDFAGWVTKNDIKCIDGLVIKHDAFKSDDAKSVPLVWQHDHNSPDNIVGRIELENRAEGVYGYGTFNDTESGKTSKELVRHGDITAMSIFAQKIKRKGTDVVHGVIKEVSLVLAGANPGATIDFVDLAHDDSVAATEAIFEPSLLIHSAEMADEIAKELGTESDPEDPKDPEDTIEHADTAEGITVGEAYASMTDVQKLAFDQAIEGIITEMTSTDVAHTSKEDNEMKTNVFAKTDEDLQHGALDAEQRDTIISDMYAGGTMKENMIKHGITNIEVLFPEAKLVDKNPQIYGNINTATEHILAGVSKIPFARIKNLIADMTDDEARARGYIKGQEKVDQIYKFLTRETYPQTIYKKQTLDRDDVIDIEEIDIINFTQAELRSMLNEEIARAILVGDGRAEDASGKHGKIDETKVRPITKDDNFYTLKFTVPGGPADVLEAVIMAKAQYRGSGMPSLYIQPELYAEMKLVRAKDGRYIFGDIPSDAAMASRLGVKEVIESTFFGTQRQMVIVNLADYKVGASKGGEVTTFDDFDIDFNKLKYLIETRISGALIKPMSALLFTVAAKPVTDVTPSGLAAPFEADPTNGESTTNKKEEDGKLK